MANYIVISPELLPPGEGGTIRRLMISLGAICVCNDWGGGGRGGGSNGEVEE